MATVREIKRRIGSVQNTQQITRAMKLVAAARLRRFQDRTLAMRPYADEIRGLLGRVLPTVAGDEHPLLRTREAARILLIVITSDRGLCGPYNTGLVREVSSYIQSNSGKDFSVMAIGRKGIGFFSKRDFPLVNKFVDIHEALSVTTAENVAGQATDLYLDEKVDEVQLFYNEFVSVITQRPVAMRLLPFKIEELVEEPLDVQEEIYIYEPSLEDVCGALLERYIAAQVYRGLLEAASSEYAARMTAMETATNNADDMIHTLTLDYNRARQNSITREILDIAGGAEALRNP